MHEIYKYMKNFVTVRNNYTNVAKTTATNHQIELAADACSRDLFAFHLLADRAQGSYSSYVFACFDVPLTALSENRFYQTAPSLTVECIVYATQHILCVSVSDDLVPEFMQVEIIHIDQSTSQAVFVGKLLNAINFCEHFHAWLIDTVSNKKVLVFQKRPCVSTPSQCIDTVWKF